MTPSPDTRGAHPEQLLEEVREYLDRFTVGVDMLPPYLLDLATALSECREALRNLEERIDRGHGTSYGDGYMDGLRQGRFAAQPPSEASERSGNDHAD